MPFGARLGEVTAEVGAPTLTAQQGGPGRQTGDQAVAGYLTGQLPHKLGQPFAMAFYAQIPIQHLAQLRFGRSAVQGRPCERRSDVG